MLMFVALVEWSFRILVSHCFGVDFHSLAYSPPYIGVCKALNFLLFVCKQDQGVVFDPAHGFWGCQDQLMIF